MGDDLTVLFDRIQTLLKHERIGSAAGTDEVEHTLTDGYAQALALESDRRRAEVRIRELAGHEESVGELRTLKVSLSRTEEELSQLRDLLRVLAATL